MNHSPAPARLERLVKTLRAPERPVQIRIQDSGPIRFADLRRGFLQTDPGGIDQNFDGAESLQHGVAKGIDGFAVENIHRMRQRATMLALDLLAGRFNQWQPAAGGRDVRSMLRKTDGEGTS